MPIQIPKVRKIFIPDPGYLIADIDLSGADAQVVAWEADDPDLKAAFRAGEKIHEKNARDIFGGRYDALSGDRKDGGSPKGALYNACKAAVHATNYVGSAKTLHLTPHIAWPLHDCLSFQRRWLKELHPGIEAWHHRTEHQLRTTHTISNPFGYSITFFDRPDSVLPEALAWKAQSVVAHVTFLGALRLRRAFPYIDLLLQVHDSLVFQLPIHRANAGTLDAIRRELEIVVPYPDPLIIPWGLSLSSKSWGDCNETPWPDPSPVALKVPA